jgi:hypothetical protein
MRLFEIFEYFAVTLQRILAFSKYLTVKKETTTPKLRKYIIYEASHVGIHVERLPVQQVVFEQGSLRFKPSSKPWTHNLLRPHRRYTLIAACYINGFVPAGACEIIQRERGANDADETRGTVGRDRFELYLEESFCPLLGNYLRGEPHSIVVLHRQCLDPPQ